MSQWLDKSPAEILEEVNKTLSLDFMEPSSALPRSFPVADDHMFDQLRYNMASALMIPMDRLFYAMPHTTGSDVEVYERMINNQVMNYSNRVQSALLRFLGVYKQRESRKDMQCYRQIKGIRRPWARRRHHQL